MTADLNIDFSIHLFFLHGQKKIRQKHIKQNKNTHLFEGQKNTQNDTISKYTLFSLHTLQISHFCRQGSGLQSIYDVK